MIVVFWYGKNTLVAISTFARLFALMSVLYTKYGRTV